MNICPKNLFWSKLTFVKIVTRYYIESVYYQNRLFLLVSDWRYLFNDCTPETTYLTIFCEDSNRRWIIICVATDSYFQWCKHCISRKRQYLIFGLLNFKKHVPIYQTCIPFTDQMFVIDKYGSLCMYMGLLCLYNKRWQYTNNMTLQFCLSQNSDIIYFHKFLRISF